MFGVKRYVASYIHDYDAISDGAASSGSISVWFGGSRDQAEVVQNLLESEFTPKTGISVSLSLVYQGYIESILAGKTRTSRWKWRGAIRSIWRAVTQ